MRRQCAERETPQIERDPSRHLIHVVPVDDRCGLGPTTLTGLGRQRPKPGTRAADFCRDGKDFGGGRTEQIAWVDRFETVLACRSGS